MGYHQSSQKSVVPVLVLSAFSLAGLTGFVGARFGFGNREQQFSASVTMELTRVEALKDASQGQQAADRFLVVLQNFLAHPELFGPEQREQLVSLADPISKFVQNSPVSAEFGRQFAIDLDRSLTALGHRRGFLVRSADFRPDLSAHENAKRAFTIGYTRDGKNYNVFFPLSDTTHGDIVLIEECPEN